VGLQHNNGNIEAGFGLLAKPNILLLEGHITALCNVPRRAVIFVHRINGIRRRLAVNAVGPESHFHGVDYGGDWGEEDVHGQEDGFQKEDEHAEDGDDQVELCQTRDSIVSSSSVPFYHPTSTFTTGDLQLAPHKGYSWHRQIVRRSVEWCSRVAVEAITRPVLP
jgi:hypothetical protein